MRIRETEAVVHRAVAAAAREFSDMGWVFREQVTPDIGIDALVEEVDNGFVTGRMIALVFKVGRVIFSQPDETAGCTVARTPNSRTGSAITCR